MAVKITAKAIIPAPPDAVFDFVADMHNDPQWAPMVVRVEQVRGDGAGADAAYVIQQQIGSRTIEMPIRVTHYERPKALAWQMDHPSMDYASTMRFEPHRRGTRVIQTNTETWHFAPWTLKLIAPGLVKRQMRRQHALLARVFKEEGEEDGSPT